MKKIWKTTIAAALGLVALGAGGLALNGVQASANTVENLFLVEAGGTTTECATLADALAILKKTGEARVTLLGDADASGNIWFDGALTIDLNGYTLSNTCLSLNNDDSLIYEDSSEEGTGKALSSKQTVFCSIYGGSLTINNGTFGTEEFPYTTVCIGSYGTEGITVTINGGSFKDLGFNTIDSDGQGHGTFVINNAVAETLDLREADDEITVKGGTYKCVLYENKTRLEAGFEEVLEAGYTVLDENRKSLDENGNSYKSMKEFGESVWVGNGVWEYIHEFTVEEHTCEYVSYNSNETKHWAACSCGISEAGAEQFDHIPYDENTNEYHSTVCEVCWHLLLPREEHSWEEGVCSVCEEEHFCLETGADLVCVDCGKTNPLEDMNVLVENGEEKGYYKHLATAVEKAKENATITLLNNVNLEGDTLDIDKAITLDLNGKDIDVASSENLVIAATVVIKDSVGSGCVYAELIVNTACTLEGGEYEYLSLAEGISPDDVLGYGRHFYIYDETTGKYVLATNEQIEEKRDLKVVCDCTHEEAVLTWDDKTHRKDCACGFVSEGNHFGGEATCEEKAVCVICSKGYGESLGHEYEKETDATHHWEVCSKCEGTTEKEEHKGGTATESEQATCEVCGEKYGSLLTNTSDTSEPADDTSEPAEGSEKEPTQEEEKGCKSSIGGGFAMAGLALLGLALIRRRKEN